MAKIKGSISIEQPVDVVFDEVSDIRNEPTYNPNMISAELKTEEPIGKGSEFSVKVKSRNDTMDMRITYTEFKKSEYVGSCSISDNMVVNGGLTFSSIDNGTLLEWNWDVRLSGNLGLFTPLVSIMGKRQEYEIWQGLKAKLEKAN
jgi:hypothetical protein